MEEDLTMLSEDQVDDGGDGHVPDDDGFEVLARLLTHYGFNHPRAMGAAADTRGSSSKNFNADNQDICSLCTRSHSSNMWYVKTIPGRGITICNHSTDCVPTELFSSPPIDSLTKLLKLSLSRHTDYAARYKQQTGSCLEYFLPECKWMKYSSTESKWSSIDPTLVMADMGTTLEGVVVSEQAKLKLFTSVAKDKGLTLAEQDMQTLTIALEELTTTLACTALGTPL